MQLTKQPNHCASEHIYDQWPDHHQSEADCQIERGLKPPGATTAAPAFSPALELFALRGQRRNCVTSAADEKLVFCGNKKNSLKHVFNHTSLVQKKDVTYFTKKYLSVGQALFWRFSDGRCFFTMHPWSLSLYPFARQASFLLENSKALNGKITVQWNDHHFTKLTSAPFGWCVAKLWSEFGLQSNSKRKKARFERWRNLYLVPVREDPLRRL